jgi:hypothetical protein
VTLRFYTGLPYPEADWNVQILVVDEQIGFIEKKYRHYHPKESDKSGETASMSKKFRIVSDGTQLGTRVFLAHDVEVRKKRFLDRLFYTWKKWIGLWNKQGGNASSNNQEGAGLERVQQCVGTKATPSLGTSGSRGSSTRNRKSIQKLRSTFLVEICR